MPRGRRANFGPRTRHACQQQVYSQNLSEKRQNIIRENARLRQSVSTRRSLAAYNRTTLQYDPTANYSNDDNLDIGPMTTVCRYCNALIFKRETADCAAQVEKSNWMHYLHHHRHWNQCSMEAIPIPTIFFNASLNTITAFAWLQTTHTPHTTPSHDQKSHRILQ